jgi:hypothetical protein
MNVLVFSHMFDPSLGGIETVSRTLAEGFFSRGIPCKVVTLSPGPGTQFPFDVIRQPGKRQIRELVDWADIVLFNGANMSMQPQVLFSRKPFVWVHQGYQAACIDGAGWVDGERSPLTPWASFLYHARRSGWTSGLVDGFKLGPTAPPHRAVVDGDEKSAAIAAASIVAKVTRDRYMRTVDAVYPAYGFSSHVGYITPAHSAVVRRIGPSEIHRRSFRALCYGGAADVELAAADA